MPCVFVFLRQGILHPEFYGYVIYKLRKILKYVHLENLFYKRIKSYLKKDYDLVILQQTSRLVIDPSTVDSHAFLFGYAITDRVYYYMVMHLKSLKWGRYVGSS